MVKIILAVGLMVYSLCATAGEYTVLLGVSKFTPQSDGIWWQEPFPHKLDMVSPSYGIRYDTTPNDKNTSYGIGFMRLGHVHSRATAVALDGMVANDGGYNSSTKSCNGKCWPVSQWYGSGDVSGFFGAITNHYGNWSFDVGPYIYYPRWAMHIPDWIECATCVPRQLDVAHRKHWQLGPMVGARYKKDALSVVVSLWQTQTYGDTTPYVPSLYHNVTVNMSIGYSF